jgi:TonB family protein
MQKFAVLVVVLVSACAGAGAEGGLTMREGARPPELALPSVSVSTDDVARRSFPERTSVPRLPTADRAGVSGRQTASVDLCVAPDGAVTRVAIAKGSGVDALDRAIEADLAAWTYQPYAAPAGLKVCERLNVVYVGRR